jgi:hypothetical protein
MIINLPQTISTSIVETFVFGEAEAKDDSQLEKCPVPTSAIFDFLEDQKDIVKGYRGAGKSAMVRLIDKKVYKFKEQEDAEHIVVVLDEEFDYRSIKNHLMKNSLKDQKELDVIRAVWEVLILYRVMQSVRDDIENSDSTLSTHLNEIEVLLGLADKKVGVVDIILSHKKKIGLKFDTFHPNIVDAYIGSEPTSEGTTTSNISILRLGEYRKYLERLLKDRNKRVYLLIDRLDDFVLNEDYDTQKKLLQELLIVQRTYREKCQRIKLKLFFRTDLFERLDLSSLGPDKVLSRCIDLTWRPSDIKQFIAHRLGRNISKSLELKGFEFQVDEDTFFVDREDLALLKESKSLKILDLLKKSGWKKLRFLVQVALRKNQTNGGRLTNSMDVFHSEIITSILPRDITHKKSNGEVQTIELFKFLDSHLQFSHGQTTPRAVLMFLNLCLEQVKQYYRDNPELRELTCDENREFPLFVKVGIRRAFEKFHSQAWDIQYQLAKEWKVLVGCVEKFSAQGTFSFKDFKKKSNVDDVKARQFLAFITHTGLIRCKNDRERLDDRTYELPVLFRKCTQIDATTK